MNLRALSDDLRSLVERGLPVGTVRSWGKSGQKYQKQRDGSWTYYSEPGKKPKKTPKSTAPTFAKTAPKKTEPEPKKGGRIRAALGKTWETLKGPFVGAFRLATRKEARKAFKKKIGSAIRREGRETKEMLHILKKAVTPGQKVTKEERAKAINQVADLAKVALLGTVYGGIAAHGIGSLLATIASPSDEIVGMMLDGPLRRATKKVFGHEHGILPSSFYADEDDEKEKPKKEDLDLLHEVFGLGKSKASSPERALLDRVMDALFDELSKEGISDEDIEVALQKTGMTRAQADKLAGELQKLAQGRSR